MASEDGGRSVACRQDGMVEIRAGRRWLLVALPEAVIGVGGEEQTLTIPPHAVAAVQRPGVETVLRAEHAFGPVRLGATWKAGLGEQGVRLELSASLTEPRDDVRLLRWRPARLRSADLWLGERGEVRMWCLPYCGWGRAGSYPLADLAGRQRDQQVAPHWLAALHDERGDESLLLAHRLPNRWVNELLVSPDAVEVVGKVDVPLEAHRPLRSDPLHIVPGAGPGEALRRFGRSARGRRQPEEASEHVAWNSWDHYTLNVSADDVMENVEEIASRDWLRPKVRYVIVDDGWETKVGDWQPNERFAEGMDGLARRVRKAGFVPGLWSAPFFANVHSDLAREHPDWFIRCDDAARGDGRYQPRTFERADPPWGDRTYLDPTHPGVQEHCYRLYRRLSGWGFGYHKTDFVTNPLVPAFERANREEFGRPVRYHDPDVGLHRAHRACMEAIRAAIGAETFWLGCGPNWATGAGLMDAARMSGDIRIYWTELLKCGRSVLFNGHVHGSIWLNDPDFLVVRGRDTAWASRMDVPPEGTKPYSLQSNSSGPTFDLDEARLWASCVILSGGMVVLSDRLRALNDAGWAIVRTAVESAGGPAAMPVDVWNDMPTVACQRMPDATRLGLWNWSEGPARVDARAIERINLPARARDLWTGEEVSPAKIARDELPRHAGRVLVW